MKLKGNNNRSKSNKVGINGDKEKRTNKGKSNQEAHFIREQVTFQPKSDTINYYDPLRIQKVTKEVTINQLSQQISTLTQMMKRNTMEQY